MVSTLVAGLLLLTAVHMIPNNGRFHWAASGRFVVKTVVTAIDSFPAVQDSMEVTLLNTAVSYAQIEQMLLYFPPESKQVNRLPSVLPIDLPVEAFRITSPFGPRSHPIRQHTQFHAGIDVRAAPGQVVKATAEGRVIRAGYDAGLGAYVHIRHAFGFETVYGHLSAFCVRPGDAVVRNQEIGRVGSTGQTTGPHLHYVIKKNGSAIDPFSFCFLLRHRLRLYEKSNTSGVPASKSIDAEDSGLSSSGM